MATFPGFKKPAPPSEGRYRDSQRVDLQVVADALPLNERISEADALKIVYRFAPSARPVRREPIWSGQMKRVEQSRGRFREDPIMIEQPVDHSKGRAVLSALTSFGLIVRRSTRGMTIIVDSEEIFQPSFDPTPDVIRVDPKHVFEEDKLPENHVVVFDADGNAHEIPRSQEADYAEGVRKELLRRRKAEILANQAEVEALLADTTI